MHLKPCPFCGPLFIDKLSVEYDDDDGITPTIVVVACMNCGTCGPAAYSEEDAANKWNTRAQKADQ